MSEKISCFSEYLKQTSFRKYALKEFLSKDLMKRKRRGNKRNRSAVCFVIKLKPRKIPARREYFLLVKKFDLNKKRKAKAIKPPRTPSKEAFLEASITAGKVAVRNAAKRALAAP